MTDDELIHSARKQNADLEQLESAAAWEEFMEFIASELRRAQAGHEDLKSTAAERDSYLRLRLVLRDRITPWLQSLRTANQETIKNIVAKRTTALTKHDH